MAEMHNLSFGVLLFYLINIAYGKGNVSAITKAPSNLGTTATPITSTTIATTPPPSTTELITAESSTVPNQYTTEEETIPSPTLRPSSLNEVTNVENSVFHIPPPFQFPIPGSDGVEETFIYQVKKNRKSKNASPSGNQKEDQGFLRDQSRRKSDYEAMQNYVNDMNYEMSSKIRDLANSIQNLHHGMKNNASALNSTLHYLNQEMRNLTTLFKETSHSVKVLQYSQEQERISLVDQVSNLTDRIDRIQHERSEEIGRITTAISRLQMKLENSSQEIRVHDIHLRYGQQVMTSMRNSIEKNSERITGLETDGGSQWSEQTVGCGGVIIANSGIVSYKYRQPYLNNERCVWIIRANRRTKINLQLLDDGFQNQSNSDYLTVTEFADDTHPVTLITSTRLEHGNKALHTFQGPIIFVTFYSDSSAPGTGFTLRFDGTGNRTDASNINAIRYTNQHFAQPSGIFTHPTGYSNQLGTTYQPNELVTLAINPPSVNSVKIQMKTSDLEKDEYCEFDSVSFYGSVTGSYALTKRYCQQGEKLNGEIIQSSDGLFLVIFRSDASTQFAGFQFTWSSD